MMDINRQFLLLIAITLLSSSAVMGEHLLETFLRATLRSTVNVLQGDRVPEMDFRPVVKITTETGPYISTCSGATIGYCVLTAYHCIEEVDSFAVTDKEGNAYTARKGKLHDKPLSAGGSDLGVIRLNKKPKYSYDRKILAEKKIEFNKQGKTSKATTLGYGLVNSNKTPDLIQTSGEVTVTGYGTITRVGSIVSTSSESLTPIGLAEDVLGERRPTLTKRSGIFAAFGC